jgi:hypothetical protein
MFKFMAIMNLFWSQPLTSKGHASIPIRFCVIYVDFYFICASIKSNSYFIFSCLNLVFKHTQELTTLEIFEAPFSPRASGGFIL